MWTTQNSRNMLRISLSNSKKTNEKHIKNSKYFLVIDPICSTTQNDHTLWFLGKLANIHTWQKKINNKNFYSDFEVCRINEKNMYKFYYKHFYKTGILWSIRENMHTAMRPSDF